MLVKILGGADVVGGIFLIFLSGANLPHPLLIFFGIVFLIKSAIGMLRDFASWIDGAASLLFFLLTLFNIPWVICLIVGILLIQKGIFSFL